MPSSAIQIPSKVIEQPLPGSAVRYVFEALKRGLTFRPSLILCGHINLLPLAVLLKKMTDSPIVLEAYGIEVWKGNGRTRAWAIAQADTVIAISRYTREKLIVWSGIAPHKVKVLPNAIRLEQYSNADKPEYLVQRYSVEGKRVLLTVGRLSGSEQYKGHDRVIRLLPKLAEQFPDLIYLVAGDGNDRSRLEELAAKIGAQDCILFIGKISEEEKVDHYNLADAFAMPSTGEGFGFVFLEAAACGLPVLGGGVDGSRDALVDGLLGAMVDPLNPAELLNGLEEVLRKKRCTPDVISAFSFSHFKTHLEHLLMARYEQNLVTPVPAES